MFDVRASLRSDLNEGWVWVSDQGYPPRSIVKIESLETKAFVYCEALNIDKNFLAEYNQKSRLCIRENVATIVISDWYRKKLGDIQKKPHNLKISLSNGYYGKFMACMQHPQIVVRLATSLALISVILGMLGLILGL